MKKITLVVSSILSLFLIGCTAQTTHYQGADATAVKSQQPATDSAITAKIKSLYLAKKLFSTRDVAAVTIHVETVNGVVYLSGTADNAAQAQNAVKLARSVQGVTHVQSNIHLKAL